MDSDDSDSDDSIFGRVLYRGVHSDSEDESSDEESIGSSSSEAEEEYNEERWLADLQKVKDDYPGMTQLFGDGVYNHMGGMTGRQWEEIGRDISKNTHLQEFSLTDGALDDDTMSFFSRGLTRSSSIRNINLHHNPLTAAGVRSMVPFLQNAPYLKCLELDRNNLQSEGFNTLWRTLFDSPIEKLDCQRCGIESIEIDSNRIPKNLRNLRLCKNALNAEGCRALVKLLYRGDSSLTDLHLNENKIDDEGVEILVDALQNNTSLETLALSGNYGISKRGKTMLLKLVNDISSIEATLRSNHILRYIFLNDWMNCEIQKSIDMITKINRQGRNSEEAGRSKIIETQLHSARRAQFCRLQEQDVNDSVYSEIDPLYLPEVLALIGRHHEQKDLYSALSSSIMSLLSTVNMKKCLQQQRAYYMSKVEELDAKLASIEDEEEAAERSVGSNDIYYCSSKIEGVESRRNKRPRK